MRNKYIFEIRETTVALITFIAILIQLLFQFKNSNSWGISVFFYYFGGI